MHIKEMMHRVQQPLSEALQVSVHNEHMLPVAMDVVLEEPVSRGQHLMVGVQRIKTTVWYRLLRKRGLHFVPLGHREGVIVLVVGTAASLGTVYLAYRRIKRAHSPQADIDSQSSAKP